jgi:hypothetical protein
MIIPSLLIIFSRKGFSMSSINIYSIVAASLLHTVTPSKAQDNFSEQDNSSQSGIVEEKFFATGACTVGVNLTNPVNGVVTKDGNVLVIDPDRQASVRVTTVVSNGTTFNPNNPPDFPHLQASSVNWLNGYGNLWHYDSMPFSHQLDVTTTYFNYLTGRSVTIDAATAQVNGMDTNRKLCTTTFGYAIAEDLSCGDTVGVCRVRYRQPGSTFDMQDYRFVDVTPPDGRTVGSWNCIWGNKVVAGCTILNSAQKPEGDVARFVRPTDSARASLSFQPR